MSTAKEQISEFCLVGQLVGFIVKDGYKVKYLRLNVQEREYWVKINKELRAQLSPAMVTGTWIETRGLQKLCRKTGKLTLEAESLTLNPGEAKSNPQPKKVGTAKILVCEKSSCWKRGGQQICENLSRTLKEKGLEEVVEVKRTGCLKQCKQGPNLVILPDKTKYSQVRPQEVAHLLEKHCLNA
jgi:(2Fe-2S) ferredoxin